MCVIFYFLSATCGPKGHGSGEFESCVSSRIYYPAAKATAMVAISIFCPRPVVMFCHSGAPLSPFPQNHQTKEKEEEKWKRHIPPGLLGSQLFHLWRRLGPHFYLHLVPLLHRQGLRRCVIWGSPLALLPRCGGGGGDLHHLLLGTP